MDAFRRASLFLAFGLAALATHPESVSSQTTAPAASWRLEPMARIDGNDPLRPLTRLGAIVLRSDGTLFVAQPQDRQILVFSGSGTFVRTLGRSGEGPGEFSALSHIGMRGDTLFANDDLQRRITMFTAQGELATTRTWASPLITGRAEVGENHQPTVPQVLLADGRGLVRPARSSRRVAPEMRPPSAWVVQTPFLLIDGQGELVRTLARQDALSGTALTVGGASWSLPTPFPDDPIVTLLQDGTGVAVIEREAAPSTRSSAFRITIIGPAADTLARVSHAYQPVRLDDDRLEQTIAKLQVSPSNPRPDASAIERRLRDADMIPETLPPITAVVSTQDGMLWVRREETSGSVSWSAFDNRARHRGDVRLPANQTVAAARGNLLVTTELDALGVQSILVHRVLR